MIRNPLKKILILINAIIGYFIKYKIDFFGIGKIKPLDDNNEGVIVSLTSYGRRVHSVVYYTLISILRQNERPSKIILWLDDSWNDNNIPYRLESLRKYGVTINYYRDIKSYKKLIPTLSLFPENIIVTVDDDVIYNKNLLKILMNGYRNNGKIQCTIGGLPTFIQGRASNYNTWKSVNNACERTNLVPIGVGGVLYPPHSLDDEVMNENAFSELAPNADDLWFWAMAKMRGSCHACVDFFHNNYSFDAIFQ